MRMNFIDKSVSFFSPQRGLNRVRARQQLNLVRDYEGAKHNASTRNWRASGVSANDEVQKGVTTLRNRSRSLVRDNPYARNAVNKMSAHAIGKGIIPNPQQDNAKQDEKLSKIWNNFSNNCEINGQTTFYGLQQRAFKAMVADGEVFVRWHDRNSDDKCLLGCELLEADFCDLNKNEVLDNGDTIIAGVQFNKDGVIVAYWMFEQHPNSGLIFKILNRNESVSVDAKYISHIYDADRPGQVRGVPWMASVIMRLRDLDDYQNAELMRKKIASMFGVFLSKDADGDGGMPAVLEGATKDVSGAASIDMKPGMVHELEAGLTPNFLTPQISDTSNYIKDELQAIAAGLGIPYSVLTGDLSQANYSSLREGKLDFWQMLDAWQQFIIIPQLCRAAWERLIDAHKRGDDINFEVVLPSWSTPERAWVDPLKDGKALELMLKLGIKDLRAAMAALGFVPSEQIKRIEQTIKMLKKAGIPLPWEQERGADYQPDDEDETKQGDGDEKTKKDKAA